jgi:hypothetical protein
VSLNRTRKTVHGLVNAVERDIAMQNTLDATIHDTLVKRHMNVHSAQGDSVEVTYSNVIITNVRLEEVSLWETI